MVMEKLRTYEGIGFDVIHQPEDFWSNDHGDIVLDNPPFEKKKEIITELIRRGKPFMLITVQHNMLQLRQNLERYYIDNT